MKRRIVVAGTLIALALLLTPREPPRGMYVLFLPMLAKPLNLSRGVAWSQTGGAMLGATWCYNYPEVASCLLSHPDFSWFNPCPTAALLGNEPEWAVKVDAAWAADRSHERRAECPSTLFIVGNTIQGDALDWMGRYLAEGGIADYIGSHCYSETAQDCINVLSGFRAKYSQYPLCVTEYNVTSANPQEFRVLMEWIQANFTCSAVFTDYIPEYEGTLNLLNADGAPNERGIIYRDR